MDRLEKEIGDAAGKVWKILDKKGPMSKSRIAKETKLSANLLNQAIGWLAREGKLAIEKSKKGEMITLNE